MRTTLVGLGVIVAVSLGWGQERAVVSEIQKRYGITSQVVQTVSLIEAFQTKAKWSLVVAKEPDGAIVEVGTEGAYLFCFVRNNVPDCSQKVMLEKVAEGSYGFKPDPRMFRTHYRSGVVYAAKERQMPLLLIQNCTLGGANGNCGRYTFLFEYDRAADQFQLVFWNVTGRNHNQRTRFVESEPLQGSVIVNEPTENAPFTYFIEVFQRKPGGDYARVLHYRGKTRYGGENRMEVVDSEMLEIMKRMGLWKTGDALPVPPRMPTGCRVIEERKGELWCRP